MVVVSCEVKEDAQFQVSDSTWRRDLGNRILINVESKAFLILEVGIGMLNSRNNSLEKYYVHTNVKSVII